VFLCETRQNKNKVHRLRHRLGLKGFAGVSSDGQSGGLALFWHESLDVEIKIINERIIDACVRVSLSSEPWRLTCIYGEPRVENRHRMWEALRGLKEESNLPWMIMGDFNEALWQEEHFSHTPRSERQMEAFQDTLAYCDLTDLGFAGVPCTYDNKRRGLANVKVHLDRVVATPSRRDLFADTRVKHLTSPCSDHCPLHVSIMQEERVASKQPRRHYEIMWERSEELKEQIELAWGDAGLKPTLGEVR
jgi:endonuclease/exonuclease/phosphatase family metal-dependent hydrolase